MQPPHRTPRHYTTELPPQTVTHPRAANFFSPSSTTNVDLCGLVHLLFLHSCAAFSPRAPTRLRVQAHRFSFSYAHSHLTPLSDAPCSMPCAYSLLSPSSGAPSSFSYAHPRDSLRRPSMPPSPERPDEPRLGSVRHLDGAIGSPLTIFLFPATGDPLPAPRAAVSYWTTEPRHPSLSTATPVTADPSAPCPRARLEPFLALTRPSDVQKFRNAVVWDERRRSDTESHAGPMLQTTARGLTQLAARPGINLDRRACRPSSFREVSIQCRMATYFLHWGCFVEAMLFASKPAEADRSLQNSVARERA